MTEYIPNEIDLEIEEAITEAVMQVLGDRKIDVYVKYQGYEDYAKSFEHHFRVGAFTRKEKLAMGHDIDPANRLL